MVTAWEKPAALGEIASSHIRQYADFLEGSRDQVATLTGYTGNGVLLKLRASHASATPLQVRNPADTGTVFEVANATGVLLGGMQSGTPSVPSFGFMADLPGGAGLYRAAANRLGVATGSATSVVAIGEAGTPGNWLTAGGVGLADITQTAPVVSRHGLRIQQGTGAAGVDNRAGGGLALVSYVNSGNGQAGFLSGEAYTWGIAGNGGFNTGFNITSRVSGTWGTGGGAPIGRSLIGSRVTAWAEPVASGGVRSVTPLLLTSRGENAGDQVQGIELTTCSSLVGGNHSPSQRIGLILTTEDPFALSTPANMRSKRGTSVDAHIVLNRKAATATDQSSVEPWANGILLGAVGETAAWPFDVSSRVIHADEHLGADGVYNAVGSVIDMENTRVANYYIRGGTGNSLTLFDFTRLGAISGSILKVTVGGAQRLDILGSGYIGIGTTPQVPLHVHDDGAFVAMAFRGTNLVTAGVAVPATATRRLQVSFWNGSTYTSGWIPIF